MAVKVHHRKNLPEKLLCLPSESTPPRRLCSLFQPWLNRRVPPQPIFGLPQPAPLARRFPRSHLPDAPPEPLLAGPPLPLDQDVSKLDPVQPKARVLA